MATGSSPALWTDLDKFYADVDETAGSDGDSSGGTDDSDDDGETSGVFEESDIEGASGDEQTTSESEDSVTGKRTSVDDLHGFV